MFFTTENFREAIKLYIERLPAALWVTVYVTLGAVAVGILLGLLLALGRLSPYRSLSRLATGITSILRTVPVPPFLYLLYFFILSNIYKIEPAHAGTLALGILLAPYMGEIFRSGIQSVRTGYLEAGLALGMSNSLVWRRIVVPQAVRIMLPAIGTQVVGTLLNSAFVAVMGGKDITGMSRNIINAWFTSELYFVVALTYFIIAFPMSRALSALERRLAVNL